MAENIVDSLFGPSPWQVQQARAAEQQKYAAQLANMDGYQQAKFGIAQGAGQLAQAGAGMMGYVDPAVEQSQRREAVMSSGGDLSTSAGLKAKAAQFAAAGDQQTAMKLVLAARNMEAQEAKIRLAEQGEKRKEYAAMPDMEKYAMAMAKRSGLREGTPEFDEFVSTFMYEQKTKEKQTPDPTSYREWVLANKPGTYEDFLMKGKKASGTSVTNVMPGAKELKDIPTFRKNVQDTVKPQLETIYAADKALSALDLAMKGNPSAFQVARAMAAKTAGDSQISLKEIEAAGGDPSIIGQLSDTTSVLFTGTPTVDTMRNMQRTMQAIRNIAKQKGKSEISVQRELGKEAKYTNEQLDKALRFDQFDIEAIAPPTMPLEVGKTRTLKSGKKVTREN